jgi:hypothetical protein
MYPNLKIITFWLLHEAVEDLAPDGGVTARLPHLYAVQLGQHCVHLAHDLAHGGLHVVHPVGHPW